MQHPLLTLSLTLLGCAMTDAVSTAAPAVVQQGHWARLALDGGPRPRAFATATRCGDSVVVVGGQSDIRVPFGDAWRWRRGRWAPLSAHNAPSPRIAHRAVWTGERLCVWGGLAGRSPLGDGACWIAAEDRWVTMSEIGAPSPRARHGMAWAAGRLVVFGGEGDDGEALADGAIYDPTRDAWSPLPEGGPRARIEPWTVSFNGRVAVAGGSGEAIALGGDDGAWLDLHRNQWVSLNLDGAPAAREGALVVPVEGGALALGAGVARFVASEGRWVSVAVEGAPSRRWSASTAELPDGAIVWGGLDGATQLADGARYSLRENRWLPLPDEGAPSARHDALAFYDGERVLILWGIDSSGLRDDGYALLVR